MVTDIPTCYYGSSCYPLVLPSLSFDWFLYVLCNSVPEHLAAAVAAAACLSVATSPPLPTAPRRLRLRSGSDRRATPLAPFTRSTIGPSPTGMSARAPHRLSVRPVPSLPGRPIEVRSA